MKINTQKLKRKISNGIFIGGLVLLCSSPIVANAYSYSGISSKETDYAGFSMTSKNTVKSTEAFASTSGAVSPYYNCVALFVYNSDGDLKANYTVYKKGSSTASKTYSGSGIAKAKSGHWITDSNKKLQDSFDKSVSITNTVSK